jgi:putative hydrolase of the HAD superfamily
MRAAGLRLVVVSNWDVSLHDRLAETGIAERVDGAVASAEVGAAKPASEIFARALVLAGVPADEALHVGDSPDEDVGGARAAGIEPVLLVREGELAVEGVRTTRSLAELAQLVA